MKNLLMHYTLSTILLVNFCLLFFLTDFLQLVSVVIFSILIFLALNMNFLYNVWHKIFPGMPIDGIFSNNLVSEHYQKTSTQWNSLSDILHSEEKYEGWKSSLNPTDKGMGYSTIYNEIFSDLRKKPINLCEIGVYRGGSIRMWREFFNPASRIWGVDIDPKVPAFKEDNNIDIHIMDSKNKSDVDEIFSSEMFDIIIDDGDHHPESQKITLRNMWDKLKSGGIYVIEDIINDKINFTEGINGVEKEYFESSDYDIITRYFTSKGRLLLIIYKR